MQKLSLIISFLLVATSALAIELTATLDSAFTASQAKKLKEAVQVLEKSLNTGATYECSASGRLPSVSQDYLDKFSFPNDERTLRSLIELQWFHLAAYPENFPKVKVRAFKGPINELVRANRAMVFPDLLESANVEGTFEVAINQSLLDGKDKKQIAGALIHGMLHNLGHEHPTEKTNLKIQMVAFEACVATSNTFKQTDAYRPIPCGKP